MKQITISHPVARFNGRLSITGSKSESNRLLVLQSLYPELQIHNLSNSDDTQAMQKGLSSVESIIDIGHAGTTMRFLTAFYASQEGIEKVLTGSKRMQERPISVLVDALRQLGADISYEKNIGYPPLRIRGKKFTNHQVTLAANVSSQYISALLLIAPKLPNGLHLKLEGKITSVPYIEMTCALMRQLGVDVVFEGQDIRVAPLNNLVSKEVWVESDWSSASYSFGLTALAKDANLSLTTYKSNSLQGDRVLVDIYRQLGVSAGLDENQLALSKSADGVNELVCDLANAPDIAQTIAVSCFGIGIGCHLTGLHTLKIKETDRLLALQTELSKLGADIDVTDNSLHLKPRLGAIVPNVAIDTYHDHRMAMAFAPLGLLVPITINDPEVVSKSYPSFWSDFEDLGFVLN
ncbi:MAG: 3-phosphoshikimate 1-carboxyvinyltransferase [Flavobacteriaceae bacterium]|jgi:3-phosphoshikimate 1-carboxyvinyltransferase